MKHQELICDFGILRELRKRENMSIAELSEQSGVSASVISKLERNQNTAEMDTLYRIARVFGLTLSDLISLAENKTSHCVEAERYKPNESYELTRGMSIQFDALLPHTYETLEETEIIIVHLRKGKRF